MADREFGARSQEPLQRDGYDAEAYKGWPCRRAGACPADPDLRLKPRPRRRGTPRGLAGDATGREQRPPRPPRTLSGVAVAPLAGRDVPDAGRDRDPAAAGNHRIDPLQHPEAVTWTRLSVDTNAAPAEIDRHRVGGRPPTWHQTNGSLRAPVALDRRARRTRAPSPTTALSHGWSRRERNRLHLARIAAQTSAAAERNGQSRTAYELLRPFSDGV